LMRGVKQRKKLAYLSTKKGGKAPRNKPLGGGKEM